MKRGMMIRYAVLVVLCLTALCLVLSGCACEHEWQEASCTQPYLCILCGEIDGEELGHSWTQADCVSSKSCTVCSLTEGDPLGHHWAEADCVTPQTCTACGVTQGEAKGHHFVTVSKIPATCTKEGLESVECLDCGKKEERSFEITIYTPEELYALVAPSVGEIVTYRKNGQELSMGTGFVYDKPGQIVTNYHVIDGAYSAKIKFGDEEYKVERVLSYSKKYDLAILKITAPELVPLKVCFEEVQTGSKVYAVGSSFGMTDTFSNGMVTYADRKIDSVRYIQHNAPISDGNSGGPLLNEYGEVIGINTLSVKDAQNLNFSVFVSELRKLVGKNGGITMPKFYETEKDVIRDLKALVLEEGIHYAQTYELVLNMDIGQSKTTAVSLSYVEDEDRLVFTYVEASASDAGLIDCFYLDVSNISWEYEWAFLGRSGEYAVGGSVRAAKFTRCTDTLTVDEDKCEGISQSQIGVAGAQAARAMHGLCTAIEKLLDEMAYDMSVFGFDVYGSGEHIWGSDARCTNCGEECSMDVLAQMISFTVTELVGTWYGTKERGTALVIVCKNEAPFSIWIESVSPLDAKKDYNRVTSTEVGSFENRSDGGFVTGLWGSGETWDATPLDLGWHPIDGVPLAVFTVGIETPSNGEISIHVGVGDRGYLVTVSKHGRANWVELS